MSMKSKAKAFSCQLIHSIISSEFGMKKWDVEAYLTQLSTAFVKIGCVINF